MEHLLPAAGLVKSHRPQQIELANIFDMILKEPGIAVVEAQTGTGKTYGYGVPAFLSDKQVVFTTAKKGLQSQLYEKDMPQLASKVRSRGYGYLKGRSNYLCKARFEDFMKRASKWDKDEADKAQSRIETGVTDLETLNLSFKGQVGITECIKAFCPHHKTCGYLESRRHFLEQPIRVANHAMVAQEAVIGKGMLLGDYDALVIDEAQLFPGFMRGAYSFEFKAETPERLKRIYDHVDGVTFNHEMLPICRELFEEIRMLRDGEFDPTAAIVASRLRLLIDILTGMRDDLWPSVSGYFNEETLLVDASKIGYEGVEDPSYVIGSIFAYNELTKTEDAINRICGRNPYVRRIEALRESGMLSKEAAAEALKLRNENELEYVAHTTGGDAPVLKLEPVDVGLVTRNFLKQIPTVLITSATLSSGGTFGHTLYSFGLSETDVKVLKTLPSPFDYPKQAMLYVEDNLPGYPKYSDGTDALEKYYREHADRIHELCTSSQGGAFVLVPAWTDVFQYEKLLRGRAGANYKLMAQNRRDGVVQLVERFRQRKDNVMIATKSAWEGIDIPGDGLRLVIITRVPFTAEGNAVYKRQRAKLESRYIDEGMDPKKAEFKAFTKLSVLQACTEMGQGMGRLIRSEKDRGGIAILDSRMGLKSRTSYKSFIYKTFPMKPTNDTALFNQYLTLIRPKDAGV